VVRKRPLVSTIRLARIRRLNDEENRLTAEIPLLEEQLTLKAAELEALDRSMASLTY
jgi:hypothetical protein